MTITQINHEKMTEDRCQFYGTTAIGCSCPGFKSHGHCYHNDHQRQKEVARRDREAREAFQALYGPYNVEENPFDAFA